MPKNSKGHMSNDYHPNADLNAWFEQKDELALQRLVAHLKKQVFRASESNKNAFGDAAIQDMRQDLVIKLLVEDKSLRGVAKPNAYARRAWARRLSKASSIIVNQNKNLSKFAAEERTSHALLDEVHEGERTIDLELIIRSLDSLKHRGKIAILLEVRPEAISDNEWRTIEELHPPPPPTRPVDPVDNETARDLLYPPKTGETKKEAYQRQNNYDKVIKTVLTAIREKMGLIDEA